MNIQDYFNRSSHKKPLISEQGKKRLQKQRELDEQAHHNKKESLLHKLQRGKQEDELEEQFAFKKNKIGKRKDSDYQMEEEVESQDYECSATEKLSYSNQEEQPNPKSKKSKSIKIAPKKSTPKKEYASESIKKSKKAVVKREVDTKLNGVLDTLTIVITGELTCSSRPDLSEVLKRLGAKVTGSVSKKTSILVYGHKLEDGRPVDQSNKYKSA